MRVKFRTSPGPRPVQREFGPNRLWRFITPQPVGMDILLYRDTMTARDVLHTTDVQIAEADDWLRGGTEATVVQGSWQWEILFGAGYDLEPINVYTEDYRRVY